jgi:hypothetical protein
MAQMIDLYNDILSFGNHNEDFARSRIRPANQSHALCLHTEDKDSGVYQALIGPNALFALEQEVIQK